MQGKLQAAEVPPPSTQGQKKAGKEDRKQSPKFTVGEVVCQGSAELP